MRMLSILADAFEALTFLAVIVASFLLFSAMSSGVQTSAYDPTAGGMAMIVGAVTAGATGMSLIVPPYVLARIFHQAWYRQFLKQERDQG